ncbi:Formyl-CoA transferase [Pseudonocardia dioxanivorans CB1190]|uniref:Formyl-CoA transferase n=1 Tax=Pseudonocardia dioxanivorans (strain ATCC 55486 / DSM 44775 / JCM 13855 / CB1190) TaxID=675635 RepID=F4CWS5_PSEUX|nr:CoA transferase [Pseudonocardia dioxanivorans]AEA23827.1 Formyl-CoA transferase [Pseudonocardia dioxanivorans CB1190]
MGGAGGTGDVNDLDGPTGGPLDGVLVADFSRVLAGPYATMILADLGATVVKVEGPGGDDTRTWTPPTRDGVATYYLSMKRNKRSIVLDLTDPADLAVAHRLADRADVLVENFKPGGLVRFGLDHAAVRARNESVVYCSISGFGTAGGAHLPGYDLLVQATSGFMSVTGEADGSPLRAGAAVFDVMTGLHAAVAVLAALRHRDATGEGQLLETNLLSVAMSCLVNQTSAVVAGGVVPRRMGNEHPSVYPYEPMPTGDGELIVIAANNGQFRKLCEVIGLPGLPDDPRFATPGVRSANREQLRPLMVEALAARSAAEWFTLITGAGVPCGPINDVAQGVALAEGLGLDPVVWPGDPASAVPTVRNPVGYSATPPTYRRSPPALGADSAEIRAWLERG